MLEDIAQSRGIQYRVVAIDPNESRRSKMQRIVPSLDISQLGTIRVADIPEAQEIVGEWTAGLGCNAVLEVCILTSLRTLASDSAS